MKTEEIRRNCVIVADTAQGGDHVQGTALGGIGHNDAVAPDFFGLAHDQSSKMLSLLTPISSTGVGPTISGVGEDWTLVIVKVATSAGAPSVPP